MRAGRAYIINGNWDILPSGRYMGAGTGFIYTHPRETFGGSLSSDMATVRSSGEKIEAPGPFIQDIHLMASSIFVNMKR